MLLRTRFDEPILGVPCYGLVSPIESSDLRALAIVRSEGAIFAYTKVDASDFEAVNMLEGLGFRRICTQVLLRFCLESPPGAAGDARIDDQLELGPADIRAHAAQLSILHGLDPQLYQRRQAGCIDRAQFLDLRGHCWGAPDRPPVGGEQAGRDCQEAPGHDC